MPFELDHFMLFVADRGAADAARSAGLVVGVDGLQPGTGAGHSVIFFDNAYIELVWPEPGRQPFQDAPRMHIPERCSDPAWCPLGVSLRPVGVEPIPISTWDYAAPFLPPGAVPIPIGDNSDRPHEPLIVVSLVSGRPDRRTLKPALQQQLREVTGATLRLQNGSHSPELSALTALLPLKVEQADHASLVLHMDGGAGTRIDLRPALPLVLEH